MSRTDDPRTDDAITADYRVFQRARGHRYAIDDVLTAWLAATRAPRATRILDLGTGIGSVAIMLAWKLREARLVTVEAQAISLALHRENVARNGLAARIAVHEGDFRDEVVRAALAAHGPFDLVTGTPPYFPPERALPSPDAQRTHARLEMRGGVEAYLETAARLVALGGVVVVCADAQRPERVLDTAPRLGLVPEHALEVAPREGKPALFSVWTLRRGDEIGPAQALVREAWAARDAHGARAPRQREIRRFFGLDLPEVESPSPAQRVRRAGGAAS
ncbi:MAG: methyltransferase [Sandaracinaceae bacterium]